MGDKIFEFVFGALEVLFGVAMCAFFVYSVGTRLSEGAGSGEEMTQMYLMIAFTLLPIILGIKNIVTTIKEINLEKRIKENGESVAGPGVSTNKFYTSFGAMFIVIITFVTVFLYTLEEVEVNGVLTSHEEFAQMLLPKLVIAFLYSIGIFFFGKGVIASDRDRKTEKKGIETYGKILEIIRVKKSINEYPVVKMRVLVYIPQVGVTSEYEEEMVFDGYRYPVGSLAKLKVLGEDMNLHEAVSPNMVPDYVKEALEYNPLTDTTNSIKYDPHLEIMTDEITINGVRIRKRRE